MEISSNTSARVEAEADRAALPATLAALKKMHALEEPEQGEENNLNSCTIHC